MGHFASRIRNALLWRVQSLRNTALSRFLVARLRPGPGGDLVRLGTDYGGWWVPNAVLTPGAVAYCAGAGEDITFDLALAERGMSVRTFDPTPRAIAHVASQDPDGSRLRFIPIGWWDRAELLRFYAPRNPKHVSHSAVNLQGTTDFFEAQVKPVYELMKELGDDRVDLIKMDIEGAEYRVIDTLLVKGPIPAVLCIEFDQPQPVRQVLRAVRSLQRAGYDLRKIERWNYTFTRD